MIEANNENGKEYNKSQHVSVSGPVIIFLLVVVMGFALVGFMVLKTNEEYQERNRMWYDMCISAGYVKLDYNQYDFPYEQQYNSNTNYEKLWRAMRNLD